MSDKKSIDTLVKDIYKLFDEGNTNQPTTNNLNEFAESMKDAVLTSLTEKQSGSRGIRMSASANQTDNCGMSYTNQN